MTNIYFRKNEKSGSDWLVRISLVNFNENLVFPWKITVLLQNIIIFPKFHPTAGVSGNFIESTQTCRGAQMKIRLTVLRNDPPRCLGCNIAAVRGLTWPTENARWLDFFLSKNPKKSWLVGKDFLSKFQWKSCISMKNHGFCCKISFFPKIPPDRRRERKFYRVNANM